MANHMVVENMRYGAGGVVGRFSILRNGLFADPPVDIAGSVKTEYSAGGGARWSGSHAAKWVTPAGLVLFAIVDTVVYRSTDDGQTWTVEFTPPGTLNNHSGFVEVTGANGVSYLVFAYYNSFTLTFCRFDGTSWVTDGGTGGQSFVDIYAHQGLVHAQLVSSIATTARPQRYYNPATRAFVDPAGQVNVQAASRMGGMCSVKGRLFAFGMNTGTTLGVWFDEFVLGSWSHVGEPLVDFVGDPSGSSYSRLAVVPLADGSALLFGSGDFGDDGTAGLECAHLDIVGGVLVGTRVTDTVVPPVLRATGPGDPDDYMCFASIEHEASDSLNPRRLLWVATDSNVETPWNLLEVFDETTQAVIRGTTGVTTVFQPPGQNYQSGLFQYTPGEFSIQIVDFVRDNLGLRIRFRCSGDPGNANKVVRFLFQNGLGAPDTYCTLVPGTEVGGGTVAGGVQSMTGIDADPSILHEVVWDFLANGAVDSTYLHPMPRISLS